MKLAKRFAAVALAAVLALSGLTACSLDDKTGAEKEQEKASAVSKLSSLSSSSKYTIGYTETYADGTVTDFLAASDGKLTYYKATTTGVEVEHISKDSTYYSKFNGTWAGPGKEGDSGTGTMTTDGSSSIETGEREVKGKTYVTVIVTAPTKDGTTVSTYCFDENNDLKYMILELDGQQVYIVEYTKWETTCSLDLSAIWDEAVKATSSTTEDAAA